MLPKNRTTIRTGETLLQEIMVLMDVSRSALYRRLEVQIQRVNEWVKGKRVVI